MKAFEIPVKITKDGKLDIPPSFKSVLPHEVTFKAIFLVPESSEDNNEWSSISMKQFFDGYSKTDNIYDNI